MDVLVTGGAGFIGSHVARRLAASDHDVTVLDNMEPFYDLGIKRRNLEAVREAATSEFTVVEGSITEGTDLSALVGDVDIVYHHAAQAGVRTSVRAPRKVNRINVDGTLSLLEAARETDLERFVFASSSSVYGKPESLPYQEDDPTEPVSPYGVSKLSAEEYVRVYHELHGLDTVTLRYFTVYGPRMRPNMAMTNFVSRCLQGEPPVIYGDGSQTRDFTYVTDVAGVNERLAATGAADGEVLNIGSTDNIDILSLARLIRDAIDPDLEIEFAPPREADAEHTHADVSRAKRLLDYEPAVSIEEGVNRFIDWYQANTDWYDPLVRAS